MDTLLRWLVQYDYVIYIVCTLGALLYLQWSLNAYREQRYSIFALEREEKGRELRRALMLFLLFVAILGVTVYLNFWVIGEEGGLSIRPTLALGPTATASPIIGVRHTPTATTEPSSTPEASPTTEPITATVAPDAVAMLVTSTLTIPLELSPTLPAESTPTLAPSPSPGTSPTVAASPTFAPSPTLPPSPTLAPSPTRPPPPTDTPIPPPPTSPPVPPPPPCPHPAARITSPGMGQQVNGVVNVIGTAAIENFQFYKVEVNTGGGFTVIGDLVRQPVQGGLLMSWNAGGPGSYTLRLTVVDITGNYPTPCDVNVVVP